MALSRLLLLSVPVVVLTGTVLSRGGGTMPGANGISSDSARRAPTCTSCHSGSLGTGGVSTQLSAPARSLALSESVQVSLQVSGGPSGSSGGFAAENTAGQFSSASGVQVNTSGRAGQFATHTNARNRNWTIPFTAPSTPGLVRLYAVGMAANGTGGRSGDPTALSGFDPAAADGTPVYVGVNAAGNARFGQGCVGSFGNWAVLYSDQTPSVGNGNYAVQLAGAAPNSTAVFLFGLPRATPLDLTLIGATGCGLWVDPIADVATRTSTGHAQRGEGAATGPLPLPNSGSLRGVVLGAQAVIVDLANGRTMPVTTTEGLLISIQ